MEHGVRLQRLSFPSGNRYLAGCLFEPVRSGAGKRALLFVHGLRSNQKGYEERARRASDSLDAICLTFDLSGHGDDAANFRQYTVDEHLQDVEAAYDHLASCGAVDSTRICVCGASYGGYLAALLTARRSVRRLILRAPSMETRHRSSASGQRLEELDSLQVLARYPGKALIIESERDEVVSSAQIQEYLGACSEAEHQVIPKAGHALDPRSNEIFIQSIIDWLADL